jgi:hypothetical protein
METCYPTGKQVHPERTGADAQLRVFRLLKAASDQTSVYKCRYCKGWHVGTLKSGTVKKYRISMRKRRKKYGSKII